MRMFGKLEDFDESWMELYHQIGYKFDMKYRNMGYEHKKAAVMASNNRRNNRAETIEAGQRVKKQHTRGLQKETKAKKEEKDQLKKERRANGFD